MEIIKNAKDVPAAARAVVYQRLMRAFEKSPFLYIGASNRAGGFKFQDALEGCVATRGLEVDVMEPWRPYCDWLEKYQRWIREVLCTDVLRSNIPNYTYEAVMFWHGPEHVAREHYSLLFAKLESMAREFVIVGAPWGEWPQEIGKDKNPWQVHRSVLDPVWLESIGYSAVGVEYHEGCPPAADNGRNAKGHLVAWKELRR